MDLYSNLVGETGGRAPTFLEGRPVTKYLDPRNICSMGTEISYFPLKRLFSSEIKVPWYIMLCIHGFGII